MKQCDCLICPTAWCDMNRQDKLDTITELRANALDELQELYNSSDTRDEMYHATKITAYATLMTAMLADL